MSDVNKLTFWRLDNPILWGAIITFGLVSFYGIVGFQKDCVGDICVSKFERFMASAPNEMGDTLAGIAGVLAFLWIIVTVLLQSQELAAQREELTLTRREMEEQRKATQDMAKAMTAQTQIYQDELERRLQDASAETLQEVLLTTRELLETYSSPTWGFLRRNKHGGSSQGSLGLGINSERSWSVEFFFEMVFDNLDRTYVQLSQDVSDSSLEKLPNRSERPYELIEAFDRVLLFENELPEAQQERFSRLRVDEIQSLLKGICKDKFWEADELREVHQ